MFVCLFVFMFCFFVSFVSFIVSFFILFYKPVLIYWSAFEDDIENFNCDLRRVMGKRVCVYLLLLNLIWFTIPNEFFPGFTYLWGVSDKVLKEMPGGSPIGVLFPYLDIPAVLSSWIPWWRMDRSPLLYWEPTLNTKSKNKIWFVWRSVNSIWMKNCLLILRVRCMFTSRSCLIL